MAFQRIIRCRAGSSPKLVPPERNTYTATVGNSTLRRSAMPSNISVARRILCVADGADKQITFSLALSRYGCAIAQWPSLFVKSFAH